MLTTCKASLAAGGVVVSLRHCGERESLIDCLRHPMTLGKDLEAMLSEIDI